MLKMRADGPFSAEVVIVLDFPSQADEEKGIAAQGGAGVELNRMLDKAGLSRGECYVTYLCKSRPPRGNIDAWVPKTKKAQAVEGLVEYFGRRVNPVVAEGSQELLRELTAIGPKVIVAMGQLGLKLLGGKDSLDNWRGSFLAFGGIPLIPTFSPERVMKQWNMRGAVISDLKKVKRILKGRVKKPEYKFVIGPSFAEAAEVLSDLLARVLAGNKLSIACDIETQAGHITCIGIAWSEVDAICIPLVVSGKKEGYWIEEQEVELMRLLHLLLTHENVEVIGQNFLYDAQYFLRHYCYVPNFKRDTMGTQHGLFSSSKKDLGYLSSLYCDFHVWWKNEGAESKLIGGTNWEYCAKDCVRTWEINQREQEVVEAMSEDWPKLKEIQLFQEELFWPALRAMERGLRIDYDARKLFAKELKEGLETRQQWLEETVGHPLNISSSKQMTTFFFTDLKQKMVLKRKTKAPSTDDESLRTLASREILMKPLCNVIAEMRSLKVFQNTFIKALPDIDGRMRCFMDPHGTATFRFASRKDAFWTGMNMQNIPSGGGDGEEDTLELPNIRKLFIPDEGYEMCDIDLDSADLRIVAWESRCKEMQTMINEGKKVYVEVAKEYYRDPTITKVHPAYKLFKSLCHATNYLGEASGIAGRLGLGVKEVDTIQKWYFGKFPEVKKWQEELKIQIKDRHYIENVFGYRIYFFDRVTDATYREGIAALPQSTVACLINRGWMNLYEKHPEIEVLLQVHDSLLMQYKMKKREESLMKIKECCEVPLPYLGNEMIIPISLNCSSISWGNCK